MFVQPIFLAGLAALSVPLIVHLIFRRRTKEVSLGTLRFLKIVLQENARRRRVMRWLLLSLRLACVALLALVFARPYYLSGSTTTSEDAVAILIDRSASMMLKSEGRRLIDQAVSEAKKIAAQHGEGARVEIAFFDQKVWPVSLEEISEGVPEVSYGPTNYGTALAWAHDVLSKQEARHRHLHLFSDLQRSGMDWSDVDPLSADVGVKIHDLGRDLPNNIAITTSAPLRTLLRPGDSTSLSTTVFNAGPIAMEELPVELVLRRDKTTLPVERKKIRLEPGAVETVSFEIPELEEGLWTGTVALETRDDLPFDNQRHVAIRVAPAYPILVLNGDPREPEVMTETYYLESALRLAPKGQSYAHSPYAPEVIEYTGPVRLPSLETYKVVILANVESVSATDAERLAQFVDPGGGLLVFGGESVNAKGYQELAKQGLTAGELLSNQTTTDLPWRLRQWDTDHSVFQVFADPQHGDLRRLAFRGYNEIRADNQAKVLASFEGGDPAVLELAHGKGQVLWFASSCDRLWSDWSRGRLFLPLVHQLLGYLTGLSDGGPVRQELLDGEHANPDNQTPGVFPQDRYHQVLNVVPRESEMDRCSMDDFVNRFGVTLMQDTTAEQPKTSSAVTEDFSDAIRDNEYWHWILIGLIGLLTAEFFVANRTTV